MCEVHQMAFVDKMFARPSLFVPTCQPDGIYCTVYFEVLDVGRYWLFLLGMSDNKTYYVRRKRMEKKIVG